MGFDVGKKSQMKITQKNKKLTLSLRCAAWDLALILSLHLSTACTSLCRRCLDPLSPGRYVAVPSRWGSRGGPPRRPTERLVRVRTWLTGALGRLIGGGARLAATNGGTLRRVSSSARSTTWRRRRTSSAPATPPCPSPCAPGARSSSPSPPHIPPPMTTSRSRK